MLADRQIKRSRPIDADIAALLIEAASVVGRPLDGALRYKLLARGHALTAQREAAYATRGRDVPDAQVAAGR